MEVVTESAPAQPEATPAAPLTAVETAVAQDDFTAYRETRRAERSGTPAPAPAAEPVAETKPAATAAPVEEPRQVSKRQQQINDYERRIALQDQRIRALEAGTATPAPAPAAPRTEPVTGETFPPYAQYLDTHPDASLEDYIDARQDFRDGVKARASQTQRQDAEQSRSQAEQLAKAAERVAAARTADPTFDDKLLPEVLAIPTREAAIAARQIPLAENDFASEIVKSDYFPQILLHVSEHPEVLQTIRGLDTRRAVLKFVAKLETRFEKAAETAPPVPVTKTISSAPSPGTTLGSQPASQVDPVKAAVMGGDVTAYRAARRAERAARR